jgi:hypothetical protein
MISCFNPAEAEEGFKPPTPKGSMCCVLTPLGVGGLIQPKPKKDLKGMAQLGKMFDEEKFQSSRSRRRVYPDPKGSYMVLPFGVGGAIQPKPKKGLSPNPKGELHLYAPLGSGVHSSQSRTMGLDTAGQITSIETAQSSSASVIKKNFFLFFL